MTKHIFEAFPVECLGAQVTPIDDENGDFPPHDFEPTCGFDPLPGIYKMDHQTYDGDDVTYGMLWEPAVEEGVVDPDGLIEKQAEVRPERCKACKYYLQVCEGILVSGFSFPKDGDIKVTYSSQIHNPKTN